jgi:TolA-binding protein
MITSECPQSTLFEAFHDGRLGPQERASAERHLASCAVCTALADDLGRIRDVVRAPIPPATPLEHQRARNALLRRATTQPASRAPQRGMFMALAAAALTLAAVSGWAFGRVTSPAAAPMVAQHLHDPRAGFETSVRPSGGARFERHRADGLDVVSLGSGALDVRVDRLAASDRFVVRTTDAELEGRGSSFRIEAEQGKIRGVVVSSGSVEVRYAGFSAVIPSGGSWRATTEPGAAPTVTPVVAPAATVEPVAPAPQARLASVAPATARASERHPAKEAPAPVVEAPAPVVAPPAAPPAIQPPSPASREFADAMRAIGRGSVAQLEAFAAAHPDDARADEAEYLRAIALQRAGNRAGAAAAATRYLATRPDGAHRPEAKQIAGL